MLILQQKLPAFSPTEVSFSILLPEISSLQLRVEEILFTELCRMKEGEVLEDSGYSGKPPERG